jgi:hypothetical protein
MKLYAISGKASREHHEGWRSIIDFNTFVGYTRASNNQEALGEAYERCYLHFPIADGWERHQAAVTEIPDEARYEEDE